MLHLPVIPKNNSIDSVEFNVFIQCRVYDGMQHVEWSRVSEFTIYGAQGRDICNFPFNCKFM